MNTILLDDGSEFLIVDAMEINGEKIVLFSSVDDPTDFCFRKEVIREGQKIYSALSGKDEFEAILKEFGLKYEK